MRRFLVVLAAVALVGWAASAVAITVDGYINDWDAGLIHEESDSDNPGCAVDIHRYGAAIVGGTLYAFTEITEPLTAYVAGVTRGFSNGPAMGMWINADQNVGTTLLEGGGAIDPTILIGTDINVEVHDTLVPASIGVEYYGAGDDVEVDIPAYHNDGSAAVVANGYIIEWSVPLSSVASALGGLPDQVDRSFPWTIYFAGEGKIKNTDGTTYLGWGRDVAGPLNIPEPGTMVILVGAVLTLVAIGLARLRRRP